MVENNLKEILNSRFQISISEASNEEIYLALLELTKNSIKALVDCTNREIREAHNLEKMYRNGVFISE